MILQVIINAIITGSTYALIAIGFNLLYSTTRFFNLAYGTLLAVGGYTFFWIVNIIGLSLYIGLALALIFTGCVGWLLEKIIFRNLRQRKSTALVMMVASIGVMVVVQSIIAILFGNRFKFIGFEYNFQSIMFFNATITIIQIISVISLIIVVTVLTVVMRWTKFGKKVRAVGDNTTLARSVGIDTSKVIASVFFIVSVIAGLTGILIGLDTGIEPLMGFNWLIKGVIAAIIGTIGYWYGGIIGAFVLAFIEQLIVWQFSSEWKDVISFIVLIVFLVVMPEGLFKKKFSSR